MPHQTDPDIVSAARELVAVGRDRARAAAVLDGIGDDPERLRAVALHLGTITSTLAHVAAQMAAEAVARGVDALPVQTDAAAPDGVLELVYRSMDAET